MAKIPSEIPGMADFEFDLEGPLFRQIKAAFETTAAAPLQRANIERVHDRPGVYGLLLNDELVYVGKADDSVRGRLLDHEWTLSGRLHLSLAEVSFRAVIFAETWNPFKPEATLIATYGLHQRGWNGKGFGIHDPGRNRDQTDLGDDHFHVRYPINHDLPCPAVTQGEYAAIDLLALVKENTPFWIRFERRNAEARREAEVATVVVPRPGMSVQELLILTAEALGQHWQLTRTPSHFLLYRESGVNYPRATVLWPSK